jgi:hypothetical protein
MVHGTLQFGALLLKKGWFSVTGDFAAFFLFIRRGEAQPHDRLIKCQIALGSATQAAMSDAAYARPGPSRLIREPGLRPAIR